MTTPPPPAVGDVKDIVVFGLLFVGTAALANGLSVTPASVLGPLKQNVQLSVFALIGNFIVAPALAFGFVPNRQPPRADRTAATRFGHALSGDGDNHRQIYW